MHTIVFFFFYRLLNLFIYFLFFALFFKWCHHCVHVFVGILWKHYENKIEHNFLFISPVIALIDAAQKNYGYGVNYWKNYPSGNSIRMRIRTSNRIRHSKSMSNSQLRTAILLGTVFGASSWKTRSNFKHKGERKFFREGLNLS